MTDMNLTLDDLITKEVKSRRGGVGKGRRGRGRGRRSGGFFNNRSSRDSWQNDKYTERFSSSRRTYTSASSRPRRNTNRQPESFTTKSGLQVHVGGNAASGISPDLLTSIQINGLHANVNQDDLHEILSKYGPLKYVYVALKSDGKSPSGLGRACYQQAEDAKKAVADLQDASIDGIPIRITFLGDVGDMSNNTGRSFTTGRRTTRYDDDEDMEEDRPSFRSGPPNTPHNPLLR